MKRGRIAGILVTSIVAGACLTAHAELRENPYQVIINRNPFALRPIPPPPPVTVVETNPPPAPPPEIKLTGITTLLGTPRVMLQVEDKQTKKPSFPVLSEGDSENGITVVAIDTENMRVRIKNGDAETTLNFKEHGVKPGAGLAAAPTPGAPQPGVQPLVPGAVPRPGTPAAAAMNNTMGRTAIVGGAPTGVPAAPNYPNNPAGALGVIPQRPVRGAQENFSVVGGGVGGNVYNPNPVPQPTPQPQISREEAEARIEAQRRILQQQENPAARILPPTTLGGVLNAPVPGAPPVPGQQ